MFFLSDSSRTAATSPTTIANQSVARRIPTAASDAVASATPFPSMLMYPADILSGRVDTGGAVLHVLVQVGWLAATVAAGQWLTRAGRRRLEVQGG